MATMIPWSDDIPGTMKLHHRDGSISTSECTFGEALAAFRCYDAGQWNLFVPTAISGTAMAINPAHLMSFTWDPA